jgi:hypothetical protein
VNGVFGGGGAVLPVGDVLGGGVNGLFGGVNGLFGGVVAGFTPGEVGPPVGPVTIGLVTGAGGAVLTRLDLPIMSLCPIGTTCGAGVNLVTMGRFASVDGGVAEALTAAAGTRLLGGGATVLSTT